MFVNDDLHESEGQLVIDNVGQYAVKTQQFIKINRDIYQQHRCRILQERSRAAKEIESNLLIRLKATHKDALMEIVCKGSIWKVDFASIQRVIESMQLGSDQLLPFICFAAILDGRLQGIPLQPIQMILFSKAGA
ncbi:hypothetical protein HDU76_011280, partial [Blyttiomyces sp. JEL0837]